MAAHIRMTQSNSLCRYDTFRSLLVSARRKAGLTQSQVAEALNRPQSYVSKYERGDRRLDFVEFVELSEVLLIDLHSFLDNYRLEITTAV